jgi:propionyl-CoA synthetase
MANIYQKHNIIKGDRIIIYMPMIPEAIFAALASARLGAIHSIVFGGFAAKELAGRMIDCTPKLVVTTNFGLEPNKTVDYVSILKEALEIASQKPYVLIYERP